MFIIFFFKRTLIIFFLSLLSLLCMTLRILFFFIFLLAFCFLLTLFCLLGPLALSILQLRYVHHYMAVSLFFIPFLIFRSFRFFSFPLCSISFLPHFSFVSFIPFYSPCFFSFTLILFD
jgi:hypothetical protein